MQPKTISRCNQKNTQWHNWYGRYVTPKTISRHNQKTDTTAQLEKKFLQPTRSEYYALTSQEGLCHYVFSLSGSG